MSKVHRAIGLVLIGGLLPQYALAYGAISAMDGFFTGLLNPISVPEQLLALLALGMMLGLRWPDWSEVAFSAFASCMLFGIILGLLGVVQGAGELALLLLAVTAATLSALYPRGQLALFVILTSFTGAFIGIVSTPGPGPSTATIVTVAGSFLGANLALLYVRSGVGRFRERFKGQWSAIGLRVVAAWIATISLLMASLNFVNERDAALPTTTPSVERGLQIPAVSYSLAYFSETITGDLAEATLPAPSGGCFRGLSVGFWNRCRLGGIAF